MIKAFIISLIQLLPSQIQYRIRSLRTRIFKNKIIESWKQSGRPVPPPGQVKHSVIEYFQASTNYRIFIETGTYLGDMVDSQKNNFKKIISIELSETLWKNATKRFIKYKHIKIIFGDSGKVLADVTSQIDEPAIFWLDAHYDKGVTAKGDTECPIFQELDSVFRNKTFNHVILIDDARSFNGQGDYPTLNGLTDYLYAKNPKGELVVEDDIIRFIIR